jgi:hypothetical protein
MKRIFLLIWVHRGLVQEPEIFYKKSDANQRKIIIQSTAFNPAYDEIDIFEKLL